MDILQEFYTLRLKMYKKRKEYLEGLLEAEASKLSNQARFIMEKCSRELVVENKKRKTIIDELIKRQYAPDPTFEWKRRMQLAEDEEEEEEAANETGELTGEDFERAFNKSSDVKKYGYLLGMSMWMLTEERKNELLRQRDVKLQELEAMRLLTPEDIWRKDLNTFSEKLTQVEQKEKADELGAVQKKDNKKGPKVKKEVNLQETMPSPSGRRIVPAVSEDLKKRIQYAVKLKENKGKRGVKKEILTEDDKDEFDAMVDNKKTLKDKIGTPEEAEKKAKGKKQQKDGFKQTKLNFKVKSEEKVNGSPKKRGKKKQFSDAESDDISVDGSDVEFRATVRERTTSRRNVQPIKYQLDSSASDEDVELKNNRGIKDSDFQTSMVATSDSENEVAPRKSENSDDLFDSLIGKKDESSHRESDEPVGPNVQKRVVLSSDSERDADEDSPLKEAPLPPKNKRIASSSDSDKECVISGSESDSKKKNKPQKKKAKTIDPTKKKPTKPRAKPKKKASVSDDDFGAAPKKKKLAKKKKANSSDESDFEFNKNDLSDSDIEAIPVTKAPPARSGRAVKQIKYNFDSDESN